MSILDLFRNKSVQANDIDEKVIDLSDMTQYPASVLANLNFVFALGDDNENMLGFLHGKWTQPKFHWGWDDITHEQAVNSNFLQRAFYALDSQHRERRDAMIASEGYKFVWRNKDVEPVPGLITGEELCRLLTKSREWGLTSIKNINASEDRDKLRWQLNPTYEDLMADMEKGDDEADYYHRDMGCGMLRFTNRAYLNKQSFIVNTALKKAYAISAANGALVGFTKDDIEWDNVNKLENNGDAYRLQACYYFGVEDYKEGVARVNWMLYPDGRYFADEDGFGMEDNDEVNVSAYIDKECRVLVKFQDMENSEKAKALYQEALAKTKNNMEELIRSMIENLREQVEEKVPEAGEFDHVYAQFHNPDKGMGVTDWMLKVTKPPKELDKTERERYLELVAYNLPNPYVAESMIGFGDKQDILTCLQDEDGLVAKIKEKMPKLASDLVDI